MSTKPSMFQMTTALLYGVKEPEKVFDREEALRQPKPKPKGPPRDRSKAKAKRKQTRAGRRANRK